MRIDAHALWGRLNRLSMSQNELARRLGASSGYRSEMINRHKCPSPAMRQRVMRILGDVSFEDLFTVEDGRGA